MSEWIKDRLPDPDDAFEDWVFVSEHGNIRMYLAVSVTLGMPWHPILLPAPYVKPKRWAVEFNDYTWVLIDHQLERSYFVGLGELSPTGGDAAQRIADAFNEVLP